MPGLAHALTGLVLSALLASGASARNLEPRQFLDEGTAVTITATREPLVFARSVPELAANARDYLNVGVVEFNRMGRFQYYLCIVSWSTVDRSVLPDVPSEDILAHIVVHLEKGALSLNRATEEGRSIGISKQLFQPEARGPREMAWYALDPEQVQRLASSKQLWLEVAGSNDEDRRFELWTDRTAELAAFAATAVQH